MTKCIVLGNDQQVNNPPKPIEFIKQYGGSIKYTELDSIGIFPPSEWDNIELICKSPYNDMIYDIMFAYDDNERQYGMLILGWWNDGVVVSENE